MRALFELAKPRVTVMVALTAAAGFALASPGPLDRQRLFWTVLGTALAAASTGCLNQVLEAEYDALMERTKRRPLPSGRMGTWMAVALGVSWGAMGLVVLAWKVNAASFAVTAFTLVSYLVVYTPMKRVSPWALWVGAVPGALPPLIGWFGGGGALDAGAAALFLLQFFWQLPHFLALAWTHRRDYARGGYRVAAFDDPAGVGLARRLAATSCALAAASLLPWSAGLGGAVYLAGAGALSVLVLVAGLKALSDESGRNARQVFAASLVFLPAVYALMLVA